MGNAKGRRRKFGSIRQLPSGRYQVRYPGPDGQKRTDNDTYESIEEAEQRLIEIQADMGRGKWVDPDKGKVGLVDYATRWISERGLSPRTVENYEGYLRNHIIPYLGDPPIRELSPAQIRTWRKDLKDAETGDSTIAKAYRFLRAVLATAEDDELIGRNPCRIKGAGIEHADERPTASLPEVFRLAAAIQPRYRLLVLLATFAQLRFGELMELRRLDLSLPDLRPPTAEEVAAGADADQLMDGGEAKLQVSRALSQLNSGEKLVKSTKSEAGQRTVSLPPLILPDIRAHLNTPGFAEQGLDGRLFVGPKGATPTRQNFSRIWKKAVKDAGANPGLHLHDLRHTGGTLTAQTGATLKEIMARLGHSSPRAALIYQHASAERDRLIAEGLDRMIGEARGQDGSE